MKTFLKSRKARLAAVVTAGLATPFGAMAAEQTALIGRLMPVMIVFQKLLDSLSKTFLLVSG